MQSASLYNKIDSLPSHLKNEALLFLDFLVQKNKNDKIKKHPKAGCMKGFFVVKKGFDEPITDFKEYME